MPYCVIISFNGSILILTQKAAKSSFAINVHQSLIENIMII